MTAVTTRRQTLHQAHRPEPRPHPGGIAMTTPGVRLVVVEVSWEIDGPASTFHPVLAIAGWVRDGEPHFEAVVCEASLGGLVTMATLTETDNVAVRLVVAAWDPAEDAERLASVIEELAAEAKSKAERNDRRAGRRT